MKRLFLLIVLLSSLQATAQDTTVQIIRYQYWFDFNQGTGESEFIFPLDTLFVFEEKIGTEGLSDGLHFVNFRFQDDSLRWSSVVSSFFHKLPSEAMEAEFRIEAYEYWVDTMYENRITGTLLPGQTTLSLDTPLAVETMDYGLHLFHIRFRDNAGQWSNVESHFFKYLGRSDSEERLISAYRYFFDQNFGDTVRVDLETPVNPYLLEGNINSGLDPGTHTINIQFQDVDGQWSSVCTDTFVVLNCFYPVAPGTPQGPISFCRGATAQSTFIIASLPNTDAYEWVLQPAEAGVIIPMDTSALVEWNEEFAGEATIFVNGVNDCGAGDATALSVNIIEPISTEITSSTGSFSLCEGEELALTGNSAAAYLWSTGEETQSIFIDQGGTYSLTVIDENGCTDEASVEVTLLFNSFTVIDVVICEGTPMTTTTILTAANGCDSTVTVVETLSPTIEVADTVIVNDEGAGNGSIDITANQPATFLWSNGETSEDISGLTAGTYSVTITNPDGCQAVFEFEVDMINSVINFPAIGLELLVFPVPAVRNETVRISVRAEGRHTIYFTLLDLGGQEISREQVQVGGGESLYEMTAPAVAGSYLLRVKVTERETAFLKVVVQ